MKQSGCITCRQRITAAFEHRMVDRLPVFDVANNPILYREILGIENPWSEGGAATRLSAALGLDAVMVPVSSYTALIPDERMWSGRQRFVDRFGAGYAVSPSSWPLGMMDQPVPADRALLEVLRDSHPVAADFDPVRAAVRTSATLGESGPAVFAGIRSAFSFLSIICGLETLCCLIYEDPVLLHALVEESTRYWTEVGQQAIETGCDALYVANDMGMNGATLVSPGHLREFFLPLFAQQCDVWHAAGGKVILHSCGNVNAILPDLATMRIDALNNLQKRSGMDIKAVKQAYGDAWTLIGNVDATTVMTSSDPSDIDQALEELIRDAGSDGALVIATDHSFHQGIPVANVLHFIESAKRLGSFSVTRDGGVQ